MQPAHEVVPVEIDESLYESCSDVTFDTIDEYATKIEVISGLNKVDNYYPYLEDTAKWIREQRDIKYAAEEARKAAEEEAARLAEEEAARKAEEAAAVAAANAALGICDEGLIPSWNGECWTPDQFKSWCEETPGCEVNEK